MSIVTWFKNLSWLKTHLLEKVLEEMMADMEMFQQQIAQINDATNSLADEVARLREIIAGGGLTPEQEQEVLDQLAQVEERLRAIAS